MKCPLKIVYFASMTWIDSLHVSFAIHDGDCTSSYNCIFFSNHLVKWKQKQTMQNKTITEKNIVLHLPYVMLNICVDKLGQALSFLQTIFCSFWKVFFIQFSDFFLSGLVFLYSFVCLVHVLYSLSQIC